MNGQRYCAKAQPIAVTPRTTSSTFTDPNTYHTESAPLSTMTPDGLTGTVRASAELLAPGKGRTSSTFSSLRASRRRERVLALSVFLVGLPPPFGVIRVAESLAGRQHFDLRRVEPRRRAPISVGSTLPGRERMLGELGEVALAYDSPAGRPAVTARVRWAKKRVTSPARTLPVPLR
jgi:hypothetical protein